MPELIDKNAMIAVFEKIASKSLLDDVKIHWALAIEAVNRQPTIEAEPVKSGRWIFGSSNTSSWMKCSVCCKSQSGQTATFSYCPNCGAKMQTEPPESEVQDDA